MKKISDKILVYVSKQNINDNLSLMLFTENNGAFISSCSNTNESYVVKGLNMIHVSGDKNYISKYLADWLISISRVIVNSDVVYDGDEYDVINTTMPRKIIFMGDSHNSNLRALNKIITELLSFNDNIRIIKILNSGNYVLEDTIGKVIISSRMMDLNAYIRIQGELKQLI